MICKGYISEEVKRGHKLKKQAANFVVFADKTSNIYEIPKQQHKKLLHDNVIKTYIKAPPKLETSINLEAKIIAELIHLDDRIECIARTLAFITLKYHKQDFRQNPPCWLINSAKNKFGKVSKLIIEKNQ